MDCVSGRVVFLEGSSFWKDRVFGRIDGIVRDCILLYGREYGGGSRELYGMNDWEDED